MKEFIEEIHELNVVVMPYNKMLLLTSLSRSIQRNIGLGVKDVGSIFLFTDLAFVNRKLLLNLFLKNMIGILILSFKNVGMRQKYCSTPENANLIAMWY